MLRSLCFLAAWAMVLSSHSAVAREIAVGFSATTAPYVTSDEEMPGISVEIVREAFKLVGHDIKPVFQFFKRNEEEVRRGRLDAAPAPRKGRPGLHYSEPCIAYENVAVVRKLDKIPIKSLRDLPGHTVVAWQDAHDHLGGEFEQLFGEHVKDDYIRNYFDVANQEAQVRMFWSGRADIIIIADVIFDYMTSKMADHFDTSVPLERHRIFGEPNVLSVAFNDPGLRDEFDEGLVKLRARGGIEKIYNKYRTHKPKKGAKTAKLE
ncbi:MAG: transporter substrate-binding domain-containing protein [Pseudomonadota bacterium]